MDNKNTDTQKEPGTCSKEKRLWKLGTVGITTVIPTLGRQKQEDYEFEVSLGYKHTRK